MPPGGSEVEIQDGLGPGIHQEGDLEGLDLQLGPLGVVAASIGALPAGGVQGRHPIALHQGGA